MPPRHREEVLNTVLAQLIVARGLNASPEAIRRAGRERPDVLISFRGLRCAIEGKIADVSNAEAVVLDDALHRIDSGISQISMAIVYHESLRGAEFPQLPNLMEAASYSYCICTEVGTGEWQNGDIDAILDSLRRSHDLLSTDNVVREAADELSVGLGDVADIFVDESSVCDRLIDILGVGSPEQSSAAPETEDRRRETAAKIAALTLANAFIFQEQLATSNHRILTLRATLASGSTVDTAIEHWQFICDDINYVPIFRIAREILLTLPAGGASEDSVQRLVHHVLRVCQNRAALRHDLMGRIYHLLLHDAKYLGTYYTSVPAANLLLKLVFSPDHWPDVDWSDIEHIKDLRVGDLACGTGTLLMAACQAITDNFVRARAANGEAIDQAKLRDLHQALMEEVMHGYDVLPSAIHLTASTLGLLAPEIAFQRMHLYSVPLGRSGRNEVLLGSLEYLRTERVFTQLNLMGEDSPTAAGQITGRGMMASAAPLPNLSICVMNPPFTRSVGNNLLFGSVPPGDRSAMQAKLRRMINPSSGIPVLANTTAGLGSVFAAVADRHIISGGRLALVLPAAITTGVAWKNTRELVASSYDLEAVIASHDADKWSFSENTNLSEVLLVARKRRSSTVNGESQTMCVNLWRNPTTSVEALAAAEAILHTVAVPIGEPEAPETAVAPLIVGAQKIGEVVSIPTGQLRGNPWLACAFAQTDLIRALFYLNRGVLFIPGNTRVWNVPICTLGDIAELGPDRRDIYDGFTLTDTPTPYSALWGHRADEMTTVAADPNRWLSPLNTARPNREL